MSVTRVLTRLAATGFAIAALVAVPAAASASPSPTPDAAHCAVHAGSDAVTCVGAGEVGVQAACSDGYILGARLWDFKNYNWDGAVLDICVPRKCTASYDNEGERFNFEVLPFFDDRASSVKTFNSCDVKLFGQTFFGGSASTWIDARADLSTVGTGWNNRASSVKLS